DALASLTSLAELQLCEVAIDLGKYADGLLPTFTGVRSLRIERLRLIGTERSGSAFCRIFGGMFVNLHELRIQGFHPQVDFEPHLGLFRKLRKHHISS